MKIIITCPLCGHDLTGLKCKDCGFDLTKDELLLFEADKSPFRDKLDSYINEEITEAEKKALSIALLEQNKKAADAVKTKIHSIGMVVLSDASKKMIDEARESYDSLSEEQKKYLEDSDYAVLKSAEEEYISLKTEVEKEKNLAIQKAEEERKKLLEENKEKQNKLPGENKEKQNKLTEEKTEQQKKQSENKEQIKKHPVNKKSGLGTVILAVCTVALVILLGFLLKKGLNSKSDNDKPVDGGSTKTVTDSAEPTGIVKEATPTDSAADYETEKRYLSDSIERLKQGFSNSEYQQVIFGRKGVYCLGNDGTVKAFSTSKEAGEIAEDTFSSWKDVDRIYISYTYNNGEHIVGVKKDGTVISDDSSITGLNTVCTDGSVMTDLPKDFSFSNMSDCIKIVSVETKETEVLGLSADGKVVTESDEHQPFVYYHNEWGHFYTEWSGLKDITICSFSTDLFGLTDKGRIVYGGVFGYSGKLLFDEDEIGSWTDITAFSSGGSHLVALKKDGTVLSAGSNDYGQCDVNSWENIVRIEAYQNATIGYASDGKIYFTGYDCLAKALSLIDEKQAS